MVVVVVSHHLKTVTLKQRPERLKTEVVQMVRREDAVVCGADTDVRESASDPMDEAAAIDSRNQQKTLRRDGRRKNPNEFTRISDMFDSMKTAHSIESFSKGRYIDISLNEVNLGMFVFDEIDACQFPLRSVPAKIVEQITIPASDIEK